MDNHPIPQNVTGFEFKLIGEMTLRQFAYLASGAIIAYLAYLLPLPFLIKWPVMIFSSGIGVALAFLPVGGRPLDRMLFNFFRAVFSQDQYVFQRQQEMPNFMNVSTNPVIVTTTPVPTPLETVSPVLETPSQIQEQAALQQEPMQEPIPQPVEPIIAPVILQTPQDAHLEEQHVESNMSQPTPLPQAPTQEVAQIPNVAEQPQVQKAAFKTQAPTFANKGLSFDAPNLLTGTVHDVRGDVVPGVIIEVKDANGLTMRAFKTNKLGQFVSSTPLPNGEYIIVCEDPLNRFTFSTIEIALTGEIFPPLDIVSVDERAGLRKELFQN